MAADGFLKKTGNQGSLKIGSCQNIWELSSFSFL